MVESSQPKQQRKRSASPKFSMKVMESPRAKAIREAKIAEHRRLEAEKAAQNEEEMKHNRFRDGVFERHRSSSANARASSAGARRA